MRYRIGVIAILAVLAVGVAGSAFAGAQTYYDQKRVINAGLLTMKSTNWELPDPYIFYVLNARNDLKPEGWEFVNPLAPPGAMKNEGRVLDRSTVPPTVTHLAYWEVRLGEVPLEDLLQFDILFITNHEATWFRPEDREALRKLVDAGGIIWIDDCSGLSIQNLTGSGTTGISSFFLDVQFQGDSSMGSARGKAEIPSGQRLHPLLTTPYWLTERDLQTLGDKRVGNYFMTSWLNSANPPNPPDPGVLTPIVLNVGTGHPDMPMVAAGQYGAGFVICTSTDIGCAINDLVGPNGNDGEVSGPNIDLAKSEDLKFAYNVISWSFSWNAEKKNSRRTGKSREVLPTSPMWEFEMGVTPDPRMWNGDGVGEGWVTSSPVMVKGVIFCGGPDGRLYAFDGLPQRDLDNDGNPDDGYSDYNQGYPYDLIWWTPTPVAGGRPLSTPLVISTYVPSLSSGGVDVYEDVVFVVDRGEGTSRGPSLHAYRAFPRFVGGPLEGEGWELNDFYFSLSSDGRYSDDIENDVNWLYTVPSVPSPVYHEGDLYIAAPNGPIWCMTLPTPGEAAITPREFGGTSSVIPIYDFSPTIGYVRDEGSGAVDKVLYTMSRNRLAFDNNTASNPGRFRAYWLGARNERLMLQRSGSYNSRAVGQIANWFDTSSPWAPLGWSINAAGTLGVANITPASPPNWNGAVNATDVSASAVYVDYNYDFTSFAVPIKPRTQIPSANFNGSTGAPLLAPNTSVAISDKDLMYYGTVDGRVVCVQERYKYPSASDYKSPADDQYFVKWVYNLGAGMRVTGTPVVADGVVYVTSFDMINRVGYISAFNADPVLMLDPNQTDSTYQLADPDTVRLVLNEGPTPSTDGVSASGNYARVFSVGSDGIVYINTMFDSNNNQVLTLGGEPIMAKYRAKGTSVEGSISDTFEDEIIKWASMPLPTSTSGFNCGSTAGPSVIGKDIVIPLDNGDVVCLPKDGSAAAGNLPVRAPVVIPDPEHPPGCGMAVANGLGVVANAGGLYALGSQVTVIADSNRIIEMNESGQALWVCDSTSRIVTVGGPLPITGSSTTTSGHIVRYTTQLSGPRTVAKLSNSDYTIADTGNNRVVQINRAGEEVWVLDRFQDPYRLLPSGSTSLLNAPCDFQVWEEADGEDITETHYLIADTGNYRVMEIVTKHDENGEILDETADDKPYWDKVLVWISEPTVEGLRHAYTSARRVFVYDAAAGYWKTRIVCTIGNIRYPSALSMANADAKRQESGGSIVEFSVSYDDATKEPLVDVGHLVRSIDTMLMLNGEVRALSNPVSVDLTFGSPVPEPGLGEYTWTVVDEGIVYVCSYDPVANQLEAQEVYRGFVYDTGGPTVEVRPFVNVTSAKWLAAGRILVTDTGANGVIEMNGPSSLPEYGLVVNEFLVYPGLKVPKNTQPLAAPLFSDRTW